MALDVVCKMQVDPKTAPAQSEYKGKTYYFCARGCKVAFDKDPEKYLSATDSGEHHHHGSSR
jgi:Cu+-exporting ATPase